MDSGYSGPLNLGRDEMVTINELADIAMKAAGVVLRKVNVAGPQGVRGRNSDNSLCRKIIHWSPEIDLHRGLGQTYHWIQDEVNRQPALAVAR